MNKKLALAVVLAALVGSGAFAQLMFGVSGALYMDTTEGVNANQILDQFKSGENIWYGGFLEIAGKHIGLGFSFNSSAAIVDPITKFTNQNYDAALYLAYHLFGARALIDPIGEFGVGALAQMNDQSSNLYAGTAYWYGALGLGVNLGPIGIFAKFAYDFKIGQHLTQTDEAGNKIDIPYYQANDLVEAGYMPNFRLTAGVKLIL
jgi:hypothetical protein